MVQFLDLDKTIDLAESPEKVIEKQKMIIQNLKSVINELPGSIYWKDKKGVYLGHNSFSAEKMKMVGLPWHSIIGKTDYDLFPKKVADQYRQYDLEIMSQGAVSTKEESVTLPTGEVLVQLSCKRPLRDERGEVIGIVGNTVDITSLKKAEKELREAKERAEKANQAKNEFIKHMEHDIRTPFNGIWVLANLLELQEVDEEKNRSLQCISRSAKELLDYCNNILELIKTEASVVPILEKKFNLKKIIEKAINMEEAAAKSKNLKLIFDFSEKVPEVVMGDPNRIQRILLNLIGNAIKFTEIGYVKVSVKFAKKVDAKNLVIYLLVKDTGVGISPEKQAFIHEKIDNISPITLVGYRGYGIGLPLIKLLIKEIGGEIDLKSQLGKGTEFICTIPLRLPLTEDIEYMDL